MAICHTPHGEIPGKSNGKSAWYCYGGKEVETHDFSYVVVKGTNEYIYISVTKLKGRFNSKPLTESQGRCILIWIDL